MSSPAPDRRVETLQLVARGRPLRSPSASPTLPAALAASTASSTPQGRSHRSTSSATSRTDEWTRTFALDTHGCFHLARAALPILKQQKGGSLTAVTTTQFSRHVPMSVLSSAPKAAIESMLQVAAREYGRYGVRANAVRSGWLDGGKFADGIGGQVSDKAKQAIVASHSARRARRSGRRRERRRVPVVARGALRHRRGTVGRRRLEAVSAAAATIEPFRIAIPDAALDDLQDRLRRVRWPDACDRGWLDPGCAARVPARAGRVLAASATTGVRASVD